MILHGLLIGIQTNLSNVFFFPLNQNLKQAACKRRMFKTLTNVLTLDITNKL